MTQQKLISRLLIVGVLWPYSVRSNAPNNLKDSSYHDFTEKVEFIAAMDQVKTFKEAVSEWNSQEKYAMNDLQSYQLYWGRIQIQNTGINELWVARLGNIHIETIEVFVIKKDGSVSSFQSGQYISARDKFFKQDNEPYIPLNLGAGDRSTVYFKFKFYEDVIGAKNIKFEVIPLRDFVNTKTNDHTYLAFILGAYFILVFCSGLLFITTREKLYLFYFLYILIGAIFVSAYDGLLSEFLLGPYPYLFKFLWVIGCAAPTIYLLFMREFLSLSETMKKFDWAVNVVVLVSILSLLVSFVLLFTGGHFDDASYIIHYMILGQMGFMLISQFILLKRILKDFRVVFFTTGSLFYLGTSFYFEFQGFGTSMGIATAALIEGLIFASGMGYRLYLNQRMEQIKLEEKVDLRTKELNYRNIEIQQANVRIEALMKEMHHRIKNNLQMLVGLLNIQQRRIKEKPTQEVLDAMRTRVNTIGLVHEYLYRTKDLKQIELAAYIKKMVRLVLDDRKEIKVKYNFNVANEKVDIDQIITIGLILHELLINSLKYGISAKNPSIEISLTGNDDELTIQVNDNGNAGEQGNGEYGFGFSIIETLIGEEGSIDKKFTTNGSVSVKLRFHNHELKA